MTNYSKKTSLWNLLNESRIEIPIIQRDYAQGRIGKEYLRERFLTQLFDALDPASSSSLVLDFVYGGREGNTFYPLDGQQRLTTLWLLHWYLSLCSGSLESDKEVLSHFSYTTRVSSRTFCEKLCSINNHYDRQEGIIDFIRDQHWFFSSYEQDPTIQSMLCMLGGTSISGKDGNDIIDGIEEICASLPVGVLKDYLTQLKGSDSPIKFHLLYMEDKNLPLSDDLYIKMNARGKLLTDFENFKVDLLNYKPDGKTLLIDEDGTDVKSFSHLLDTSWTDIFWYNHSVDHKIDDIFFSFINRFLLNWYMANNDSGTKPESITNHEFYRTLADKSDIGYKNINIYEPVLQRECIDSFYQCMNNIYRLYELVKHNDRASNVSDAVNQLFVPYWNNTIEQINESRPFFFIPRYIEGNTVSPITIQQRVVLHAICVYFRDCNEVEIESLKEWTRFVWNMVENSYIDREQAVSAIRFFDAGLMSLNEKYDYPAVCNIRQYLADINEDDIPREIFGRRQLQEEVVKAKKRLDDVSWNNLIDQAEESLFFKGAISFLFNDEKGNGYDWDNFEVKLNQAKTIFDDKGIKDEYLVKTLSCLFSYCDNWAAQLWWEHKIFNGQASTWKENILIHVDRNYNYVYALPVHHILMGHSPQSPHLITDSRIRKLSNPSLITYVLERNENKREMYIRWPHDALYFCGDKRGVMLSNDFRDKAIANMLRDERFLLLNQDVVIPNTNLFWGFDIDFICKLDCGSFNLRWYREHNEQAYDIYLMDEDWNYKGRKEEMVEATGDRKSYFCFNIEENQDIVEQMIRGIKELGVIC